MSTATASRYTPAQLDEIRAREQVSVVFEQLGHKLRRAGRMFECLCPWHAEHTPSCQIDDAKGVFHCKGCGKGGNVFEAVMELRGCSFPQAVEYLGGTRELSPEDVAAIEKRNRDRQDAAREDQRRSAAKVERLWSSVLPIHGTHGQDYLNTRGVNPLPSADLRFAPALEYWGFPDADAQEPKVLGEFPVMVAAIRSSTGALIGVHRTYLDPREPWKLKPPGDPTRNRAKKITGEQRGGSIALSKPGPRMAYGEGIETTLSWRVLMGADADGFGLAALVSLGNVSGGSAGSVDHPVKVLANGKPLRVPNGEPDPDRPGFVPGPSVREAILLGDGDSDAFGTRMRLLTAARRWRRDPDRELPLFVRMSMAPEGLDFNDVLLREAEAE